MYQLSEKRTNALNYNKGEQKNRINAQLAEYQQKVGVHFADVKGVFEHLLSSALSEDNTKTEIIEKEITPDFAVILHDNTDEKILFENQLKSIAEYHNDNFDEQNQRKEIKIAVSRYLELINENLELLSREPEIIEKEVEITKQISLLSNQFITTLNDNELILLKAIAKKRKKYFNLETEETIEELAKKMIFNDNVVFDLGGEFYTGISAFTKRIN